MHSPILNTFVEKRFERTESLRQTVLTHRPWSLVGKVLQPFTSGCLSNDDWNYECAEEIVGSNRASASDSEATR